jgi:hypothetical protein
MAFLRAGSSALIFSPQKDRQHTGGLRWPTRKLTHRLMNLADQQIQRAKMTILYIMSVSAAVVASLIYFGLH